MKKSTLADALSVNQKLLDLAEKASDDEKKDIEDARKTFCDLIVHLSSGILRMGDAMDKQNDTIKQYQKALEWAAHDFAEQFDCNEKCPNFKREVFNKKYGDISLEECKKSLIKNWKRSAGIGVIDTEVNEVKS